MDESLAEPLPLNACGHFRRQAPKVPVESRRVNLEGRRRAVDASDRTNGSRAERPTPPAAVQPGQLQEVRFRLVPAGAELGEACVVPPGITHGAPP